MGGNRGERKERMARPRLHPSTLAVIARSHGAGTSCAELAKIYGITKGDVTNITRKWQTDQMAKRAEEERKQARQVIVAPPMETPDPGSHMVPIMYQGKPIIRVVKWPASKDLGDNLVSLPYLAIQGAR